MNQKYTFHIAGLPHTATSKEYLACAFTQKVLNFSKMMKSLGHEVIHYGGEGSEDVGTENVQVFSDEEREQFFGKENGTKDFFPIKWDPSLPYWRRFNGRVVEEMKKRIKPKDFICLVVGTSQREFVDSFPNNISVEFGIGHGGSFSKFRVFESYAWMHATYGAKGLPENYNPSFYDAVIPGYVDPADLPFQKEKEDYLLFVGRLIDRKGYMIAVETAKKLGKRLVVAGQGTPPEGVDYRGVVGVEERAKLMGGASALFVPTQYIEPFGTVAIEAMMCGTPVISTDWGAFTETVLHGVTGFRCRTLEQFVWAAKNAHTLKPEVCREWAMNYSLDRVALRYQEYFDMLYGLWTDGWNRDNEGRTELDWLKRNPQQS